MRKMHLISSGSRTELKLREGSVLIQNGLFTGVNPEPYDISIHAGDVFLLGGDPSGNGGTAEILSTYNLTIETDNNLKLIASTGSTAIQANNGLSTFTIGKDVFVEGGSTSGGSSQIGLTSQLVTTPCSILFTNVGGDILITGGSASNAFALIGHGRPTTATTFTGDVVFENVGGDVNLIGGTATGSFAHVGHVSSKTATTNVTAKGDVRFDNVSGTVRLTAGSTASTTDTVASIGHGDPTGTTNTDVFQGFISVNAGAVELLGGNVSSATIGFQASSNDFTVNFLSEIAINTVNDVVLQASTFSTGITGNAIIGCYNVANFATFNVNVDQIKVSSTNGNISLYGGHGGASFTQFPTGGVALIGTANASTTSGAVAQSNIRIQAPNGTLNLFGEPTQPTGATIVNFGLAAICNFSDGIPRLTISILKSPMPISPAVIQDLEEAQRYPFTAQPHVWAH